MSVWLPDPGVLVFDLSMSTRTLARLRAIAKRAVQVEGGPNSMNRYGSRVVEVSDLQSLVMLSRELCWDNVDARAHIGVGRTARSKSAFTVEYDGSKQRRLERHVDSSDVTMNVCIDGDFWGGELVLYRRGVRRCAIAQAVGVGFIHRGKLEHRAAPIVSGTRRNLVLWWRRAAA